MRSREVGIVVTQLTMLIAAWDPSRCQHRLGSRTQLTVTARNPPIVDAASRAGNRCYRLPSGTFTKGANFHWGLDHLMNPHFTKTRSSILRRFAGWTKPARLYTTCFDFAPSGCFEASRNGCRAVYIL